VGPLGRGAGGVATPGPVSDLDGRVRLVGLRWERGPESSQVTCRVAWREQVGIAAYQDAEPARAASEACLAALGRMGDVRPLKLVDQVENQTKAGAVWLVVVGGPEGETVTGSAMGRHEVEAAAKAVLSAVNRRFGSWTAGGKI
jgi:hypothetical protein